MRRGPVVAELLRTWQGLSGNSRAVAPAPGQVEKLRRTAAAVLGAGSNFKRAFVRIEVYERFNYFRPEVPTNIWEAWPPRACLTPNVLRDYEDWPRRILPAGMSVDDVDSPDVLYTLARDDRHRLVDVVNVERRASDRLVQDKGFLGAEVDQPPDNNPFWHKYLVWIAAGVFVAGALLVVVFMGSG
jgi:hypothetical protein